jgi:UDP-N-acetylmuramoylalanine--D-glutamate ligase
MIVMTAKQREYVEKFRGKKAAVLGIGMSNAPVIKFLVEAGAHVVACDVKREEQLGAAYRDIADLPVEFRLGEGYLQGLDTFDMIFPTPGMPLDLPELVQAREKGVWQSNEIGLFLDLCDAIVVGITGSDGKTTTTTLVGKSLEAGGKKVFIGGNIGKPLLSQVFEIAADSVVVLELSSFQLQPLRKSPHVGVILNLSPNHLDHHRSMAEYAEAKENIFRYQTPRDYAVLNWDNPWTRSMGDRCPGGRVFFSRHEQVPRGVFLKGEEIIIDIKGESRAELSLDDIRLPGEHNVENILAVSAVVALCGGDFACLRGVAKEFAGVEHRIQFVAEKQGVKFYDDSSATTPSRCIAGIKSSEAPVVLIAGGSSKKLSFEELGEVIAERVKCAVLVGHTASEIQAAIKEAETKLGRKVRIVMAEDFEEAVHMASSEAAPGDAVLLSPACASFDFFRNYKDRGERFRDIVQDMK